MKKQWYLSFVKEDVFVGACLVEADSTEDAVREAWRRAVIQVAT